MLSVIEAVLRDVDEENRKVAMLEFRTIITQLLQSQESAERAAAFDLLYGLIVTFSRSGRLVGENAWRSEARSILRNSLETTLELALRYEGLASQAYEIGALSLAELVSMHGTRSLFNWNRRICFPLTRFEPLITGFLDQVFGFAPGDHIRVRAPTLAEWRELESALESSDLPWVESGKVEGSLYDAMKGYWNSNWLREELWDISGYLGMAPFAVFAVLAILREVSNGDLDRIPILRKSRPVDRREAALKSLFRAKDGRTVLNLRWLKDLGLSGRKSEVVKAWVRGDVRFTW